MLTHKIECHVLNDVYFINSISDNCCNFYFAESAQQNFNNDSTFLNANFLGSIKNDFILAYEMHR